MNLRIWTSKSLYYSPIAPPGSVATNPIPTTNKQTPNHPLKVIFSLKIVVPRTEPNMTDPPMRIGIDWVAGTPMPETQKLSISAVPTERPAATDHIIPHLSKYTTCSILSRPSLNTRAHNKIKPKIAATNWSMTPPSIGLMVAEPFLIQILYNAYERAHWDVWSRSYKLIRIWFRTHICVWKTLNIPSRKAKSRLLTLV